MYLVILTSQVQVASIPEPVDTKVLIHHRSELLASVHSGFAMPVVFFILRKFNYCFFNE